MTISIIEHIYSQRGVSCHDMVNLNTASAELLADVSNVGRARVEALIQRRPFHNWDDVARVPGISESIVERLKNAGAALV